MKDRMTKKDSNKIVDILNEYHNKNFEYLGKDIKLKKGDNKIVLLSDYEVLQVLNKREYWQSPISIFDYDCGTRPRSDFHVFIVTKQLSLDEQVAKAKEFIEHGKIRHTHDTGVTSLNIASSFGIYCGSAFPPKELRSVYDKNGNNPVVYLHTKEGNLYPLENCEMYVEPIKETTIPIHKDYTALIKSDGTVKVGCSTFDIENIKKIIEEYEKF